LKNLFLPFVIIFSIVNIICGIIAYIYPNYASMIFSIFVYVMSVIGIIAMILLSFAGFKIYFILKKSTATNANRIVKKIIFFVFTTITLLTISTIGQSCAFFLTANYASSISLLATTIPVLLFILINGLGISWGGTNSESTTAHSEEHKVEIPAVWESTTIMTIFGLFYCTTEIFISTIKILPDLKKIQIW